MAAGNPSCLRADRLAATMVQEALADFAERGFKLVQSVVDESAGAQASRALEKGGMPRVTEMLYLERATAGPLDTTSMPTGRESQIGLRAGASSIDGDSSQSEFIWHAFDEIPELEFRRTLAETYAGSLDMPELEGARSFEEILEGYKAVGSFAPERWMLGQIRDEPDARAVLLLAENQSRKIWEVLYLGLTPAARGPGAGACRGCARARAGATPRSLARAHRRCAQHAGAAAVRVSRIHRLRTASCAFEAAGGRRLISLHS